MPKNQKSLKSLFLIILLFLAALGMKQYWDTETLKENYEANKLQLLESKWEYTLTLYRSAYEQASYEGAYKADMLSKDIRSMWVTKEERHNGLRDLEAIDNPIYPLFRSHLEGYFFRGIENDANDPFIIILGDTPIIAADYSINCLSGGRTRVFAEEYPMHADIDLARVAFARLQYMDLVDKDRVDPIFFQFEPHIDPNFKLTKYSIEGFKSYFLKSNGDWKKTFNAHEFIVPTYLYPDTDLSEVNYVTNDSSISDARIIILNNVFNLKDVISNMHIEREVLEAYEGDLEVLESTFHAQTRSLLITGLLILVIALIAICKVHDTDSKGKETTSWNSSKTSSDRIP